MPGTELPPSVPAHQIVVEAASPEGADDVGALERVAVALGLLPRTRPAAHQLLSRRFGDGLERVLEDEGVDAVRAGLVEAWLADPDQELLDTVATWAYELCLWEGLEQIWIFIAEQTSGLSPSTLGLFRGLPVEARRARPILTWASGAAESLLAEGTRQQMEGLWQRLLLDSAMLHADWAIRPDTDEAVDAGTFRMIGERRMPAAQAGQSLDAAWRTKEAVDQLIDARSRAGRGPGRTPQSVFRAFSARLALFRYDPSAAISEARWAGILSNWEPVTIMAKGVEALATSISTEDGPAHYSDPPLTGLGDGLGVCGLRGMGELYELLADGHEAVRRLDLPGVDRSLSLVTREAAALAGVWAVRVALQAWRDALWGDLAAGAALVSEEIHRLSVDGREADEPLGRVLLNRTQAVLLAKAGAFPAAARVAETLPEEVRLVSLARIHLWAGQYPQAVKLAEVGPYQPGLEILARYRLALIRVAAAVLQRTLTDDLRRDAIREVTRLIQTERYIHLALLPAPARMALLDLCRPELGEGDPNLLLLQERLAGLNDHSSREVRPFHFTERELLLLPLLAGDDPVPLIAAKLHVSVNTVRKQVVTLREKFGVSTRAEMIRKARIYGAVP